MAYNHEYPYTDPYRYNSDWEVNKVKELDAKVDKLLEQYSSFEDLLAKANAYTDEQIAIVKALVDSNKIAIATLRNDLNADVELLEETIASTAADLQTDIDTKYTRNQQAIAQQWEDMKAYIAGQVFDVKVRNFFTGQLVSLQSMFDYLAGLHLQDAGTYAQASGQNTYAHFAAKNKTYGYVVQNSLTFFQS